MNAIYLVLYLTHTHVGLFKFIIAIYNYVLLTNCWPMHLKIIHLTLCHPEFVKGDPINQFMDRAPEDHSFNPLSTENISKVLK